jgi:RNA polymerase sigma factor (sigma-70 family)
LGNRLEQTNKKEKPMISKSIYNQLPAQPLPREDEQRLLRSGKEDLEARDTLLLHAMRGALKYSSTVSEGKIDLSELMSLCTTALMGAISNYDPEHKSRLSLMQFAKPFIRGEVRRYWKRLNIVNYGANIPEDTSTEQLENIQQVETVDPDFDTIHAHERWEWVEPHLKKLSETELRVLCLIYESRFTLADIGRMLECTRENVRITKNRALKKIRNGLYRNRKLLAS